MDDIMALIRDVPDFPEPGIVFRDLTPVLANGPALARVTAELARPYHNDGITAVAGMEARGFIFGALVAQALGVGFVPLRKPGKLPAASHSVSYDLEYGSAILEMHTDAVGPGDRILLIDDLIATGGTAAASCELVSRAGADIAACAFVIELDFLNGRELLRGTPVHSLIHY
jgi:adenine phosphoribosyltransferase|tara:strand:+ start:186 stop:701 length:516 start_codon:yes stop_codon:yes gene_type:complete